MLSASSYETGRLVGTIVFAVFVPALLIWWAFRLKGRGSRAWWVPLAIGVFVGLAGLLSPIVQQ